MRRSTSSLRHSLLNSLTKNRRTRALRLERLEDRRTFATGVLDSSFDTDGIATTNIGLFEGANSVAVQADGKIVVTGPINDGITEIVGLVRYNRNGSIDTTFGSGGKVQTNFASISENPTSIAVAPDGKIVVAGTASNALGYDFFAARYNSNGTLDSSFDGDGLVTIDLGTQHLSQALSVAVQTNGKVIVAGTNGSGFALARLNTNGSLDTSFDTDGKLEPNFGVTVNSLVVLSDGKILASGQGINDFAVAKFNSDGSYDTSFDTDGRATIDFFGDFDTANSVAVQSDGKILLAGTARQPNLPTEYFAIARLQSNGSLDGSFSGDGKVTENLGTANNAATTVLAQSNGQIVVTGLTFDTTGFQFDTVAMRFDASGSLDVGFAGDGIAQYDLQGSGGNDTARAAAWLPDGNIVVVGNIQNSSGTDFLAAVITGEPEYQAPGNIDPTFGRGGITRTEFNNLPDEYPEITVDSAVQPDGKLIILSLHMLARLNADGSPDLSFGMGQGTYIPLKASSLTITPNGDILVASYWGPAEGSTSLPAFQILRFDANGVYDSSFNPLDALVEVGENLANLFVAPLPDGKFIVAGTVTGGGGEFRYSRVIVGRLETRGYLDTTFDGDGSLRVPLPSSFARANSLAVLNDGRIVIGGEIEMFSTNTDFMVIRLNPNGTLDTSLDGDGVALANFGPNFRDNANEMIIQSDGKMVVGGSTDRGNMNSVTDFALARFTTTGALDLSFGTNGLVITTLPSPSSSQVINSLAIQRDGKIVVAGNLGREVGVARYLPNGQLDVSFNGTGTFSSGYVYPAFIFNSALSANKVDVNDSGKISVAGAFFNGTEYDYALLRFNQAGALDTSFNYSPANDGYVVVDFNFSNDVADAIAIQPDGRTLVAGYVSNNDFGLTPANYDFGIARYNTDGSLDLNFGNYGRVVTSFGGNNDIPTTMTLTADGKIVVVGYTTFGGVTSIAIARYVSSGFLDSGFDTDGLLSLSIGGIDDEGFSVAVQADGKLLVGGRANIGGNLFAFIVRLNVDGSRDASFGLNGILFPGFGESFNSIKVLSDGRFYAIGRETSSGSGNFALARFNSDGSFDNTFDGDGQVSIDMAGQDDTAFAAELQSDGKVVVVGYASTGVTRALAVARVNTNGSLDTTFDGDGRATRAIGSVDNFATSVAIQRNGRIIVGGSSSDAALGSNGVLWRINSDGSSDSSFGNNGAYISIMPHSLAVGNASSISALALDANGQLVVAGYVLAAPSLRATGNPNYDFTLQRFFADSVDIVAMGATTNGRDQITITYNVTGRNASPFTIGVYLSADNIASGYQVASNDTLIFRKAVTRPSNLTVGVHRVTFNISASGLLLPDLTTLPSSLLDQRLLLVLDDNNQLGEADSQALSEDNTISFTGAYHAPGGNVVVFGTEAADTISMTQTGTTVRLVMATGTYDYQATDINQFIVRGAAGDDRLSAAGVNKAVLLVGGDGADTLIGGNLGDTLYGFAGNDSITGGGGSDGLIGGTNNDVYYFGNAIGTEVDTVTELPGGGGDTLSFAQLTITTGVTVNLATTGSQLATHAGRTINAGVNSQAAYFENLIGSNGNDSLTGNAAANVLRGGLGNDVLVGNAGNDTLDGGAGNDLLDGGAGNDLLQGGVNDDTYRFSTVSGAAEVDTIFEALGGGVDTLDFSALLSNDPLNIDLGAAGITLGSHTKRTLRSSANGGGAYIENIIGGAGNDTLRGNSSNNRLEGRGGNDTLDGKLGTDTLDGGLGTDTALNGEVLLNIP